MGSLGLQETWGPHPDRPQGSPSGPRVWALEVTYLLASSPPSREPGLGRGRRH